MIIELVGTPGVGKSYLCRAIEEQIKREPDSLALTTPVFDNPVKRMLPNNLRKVWRAGVFIMRNPVTALSLYREVFKGRGALKFARCTKFVNLLSELQRNDAADRSNSLMTDQGVLQGIWSLEMMAKESLYQRIMQISTKWLPDVVILVEADLTQNRQQLERRTRGKSTFDRMRGEELLEAIERGELNRDEILSRWAKLVPDGQRLDYTNQTGSDTRIVFDWLVARLH